MTLKELALSGSWMINDAFHTVVVELQEGLVLVALISKERLGTDIGSADDLFEGFGVDLL